MGALTDSLSMYRQRASRFGEIGRVFVGEVKGTNPSRRLRIQSRSMWNGSLTTIAVLIPRSFSICDTVRRDSRVVRPRLSSSIASSGIPRRFT